MARKIRLEDIGDYPVEQIKKLVKVATLETEKRLKERTPVDTGRLRQSWQREILPLEGTVFNNLEYAAPVVAGVNYPPSWGGRHKKEGSEPFLDIVAKDMQTWINAEADRIGRQS